MKKIELSKIKTERDLQLALFALDKRWRAAFDIEDPRRRGKEVLRLRNEIRHILDEFKRYRRTANLNDNNDNLLVQALKKSMAPSCIEDKDNDKITLGNFLETLDGCMECPGRIIIFTTNNANKIDPALLRPGRIDINIKFKKCSNKIIQEMYKFFFNKDIEIEFKNTNQVIVDF